MKAKKIVGISLIVVLLLTLAAGIVYSQTDWFDFMKSSKTLFFSYLAQNIEGLPQGNCDMLQRVSEESHIANIRLSMSASLDVDGEEEQAALDLINGMALEVEERVDVNNETREFILNIEFDGDDLVTAGLLLENDALSLRVDQIIEEYITVENRNLRNLAQNFGLPAFGIPDSLNLDGLFDGPTFTVYELEAIFSRYYRSLVDSLHRSKFSSSREYIEVNGEEVRATAYILSLTQVEALEVVVALLEEAKEDEELLDILTWATYLETRMEEAFDIFGLGGQNNQNAREILQDNITDEITRINRQIERTIDRDEDETILEITVYAYRGKTVLTTLSMSEYPEHKIALEREVVDNGTNYVLTIITRDEEVVIDIEVINRNNETSIIFSSEIEVDREIGRIEVGIISREDYSSRIYFEAETIEGVFGISLDSTIQFRDVVVERPRDSIVLNDLSPIETGMLLGRIQIEAERFAEEIQERFAEILAPLMSPLGTFVEAETTVERTAEEIRVEWLQNQVELWTIETILSEIMGQEPERTLQQFLIYIQGYGLLSAEEVRTILASPNNEITIEGTTIRFRPER